MTDWWVLRPDARREVVSYNVHQTVDEMSGDTPYVWERSRYWESCANAVSTSAGAKSKSWANESSARSTLPLWSNRACVYQMDIVGCFALVWIRLRHAQKRRVTFEWGSSRYRLHFLMVVLSRACYECSAEIHGDCSFSRLSMLKDLCLPLRSAR